MDFEYSTYEELFNLIGQINSKYYERFNANILYLEELSDRIYVVYITTLRDAYSHLVRIFDYDVLSEDGKKNIRHHLGEYVAHLQRGLMDTFGKIRAIEFRTLKASVHKNNVKAVEIQIAKEAAKLRIMDKNLSFDERIEGYDKLIDFISKIREKLAPQFEYRTKPRGMSGTTGG
jgi:hypothetical protein